MSEYKTLLINIEIEFLLTVKTRFLLDNIEMLFEEPKIGSLKGSGDWLAITL